MSCAFLGVAFVLCGYTLVLSKILVCLCVWYYCLVAKADVGAALWFKFHEGFSNAVRKPVKIQDLL